MGEIGFVRTKAIKYYQTEKITLSGVATGTTALDFEFDADVGVTTNTVSVTPVVDDTAIILAGKLETALIAENVTTGKFETISYDSGDDFVLLTYSVALPYDVITLATTVGVSATSEITAVGSTTVQSKEFIRYNKLHRVGIKQIGDKFAVVAIHIEDVDVVDEMILSMSNSKADAFTSFDALATTILATDTASALAYDIEQ